ncbi:TPA: hypothetical protein ACGW3M_000920 [Pseudomonas aeruginosa]|nr:hypothetical protein [Pseudomonas aeruginosa]ELJ2276263.1 hypothetical protein [Pseudomonas aeruginosa]MBX6653666.1 hypothetical protein [Pseudomonas aeruginosa]
MNGRYYKISHDGRELMQVWAGSERKAKEKARATLSEEGRRDLSLTNLEVSRA